MYVITYKQSNGSQVVTYSYPSPFMAMWGTVAKELTGAIHTFWNSAQPSTTRARHCAAEKLLIFRGGIS